MLGTPCFQCCWPQSSWEPPKAPGNLLKLLRTPQGCWEPPKAAENPPKLLGTPTMEKLSPGGAVPGCPGWQELEECDLQADPAPADPPRLHHGLLSHRGLWGLAGAFKENISPFPYSDQPAAVTVVSGFVWC